MNSFSSTPLEPYGGGIFVGEHASQAGLNKAFWAKITDKTSVVVAVEIMNQGTGYTSAGITLSGGGGSGATATVQTMGGKIVGVTITNEGSGYMAPPTVTFSGSGTGAIGQAVLQTYYAWKEQYRKQFDPTLMSGWYDAPGGRFGQITPTIFFPVIDPNDFDITIGDRVLIRRGYYDQLVEWVYLATPSGAPAGCGTDWSPILDLNNPPPGGVLKVTITAGGSGYSTGSNVTFSGGGGSGATGTILASMGVVTGVVITNPGSGYTSAPSVNFGSGGTGATGTVILDNTLQPFDPLAWNAPQARLVLQPSTGPVAIYGIAAGVNGQCLYLLNNSIAQGSGGTGPFNITLKNQQSKFGYPNWVDSSQNTDDIYCPNCLADILTPLTLDYVLYPGNMILLVYWETGLFDPVNNFPLSGWVIQEPGVFLPV